MDIKIKDSDYRIDFETWGEFLDYVKTTPPGSMSEIDRATGGSRRLEDDDAEESRKKRAWHGTKDFEEAYKIGVDGFFDYEKDIQVQAQPIFDRLSSLVEREEWSHDKEGMGIDIAKYVENEPDCWQRVQPTFVDGKGNRVLKIIFNTTVSEVVSVDAIKRKGMMAAVLIQLLEFSGYRIELYAASCIWGSGMMQFYVPIKKADQPMDMGRMLFALSHPGYFRRLVFSAMENAPHEIRTGYGIVAHGGYGHPGQVTDKGDVIIPQGAGNMGKDKIEEWIIQEMEKCGIKFHQAA